MYPIVSCDTRPPSSIRPLGDGAATRPALELARPEAGPAREGAREVAGIGVAEVQGDVDDPVPRISEHLPATERRACATTRVKLKPSSRKRRWSVRGLSLTRPATHRTSG